MADKNGGPKYNLYKTLFTKGQRRLTSKNECGAGLVCGHLKSETDEKTCLHGNQQKCNVDKTKEKLYE